MAGSAGEHAPPSVAGKENKDMTKKWKLSDSGLQVYEGGKHIATVHYAGNPPVDINEAIENATIIRQAPQAVERLAALEADNAKLRAALELCYTRIFNFGMDSLRDPQWTQKLNNEAMDAAREALEATHE